MKLRRLLIGVSLAALFALSTSAASADRLHQCNSGGGNGFETEQPTDCDPGNSGGKNNGGG